MTDSVSVKTKRTMATFTISYWMRTVPRRFVTKTWHYWVVLWGGKLLWYSLPALLGLGEIYTFYFSVREYYWSRWTRNSQLKNKSLMMGGMKVPPGYDPWKW